MSTTFSKAKQSVMSALPVQLAHKLRQTRAKAEKSRKKARKQSTKQKRSNALYESIHSKIIANQVFYESFDGNGAVCNPRAIFNYLTTDKRFKGFHHVWAISDPENYADTIKELKSQANVTIVIHNSNDYYRLLHSSRYVISNSTFPHEFVKRDGQTYLNTWHGVPLKVMGYETPDGRTASRNVIRNFLAADYLLSTSSAMTDVMYRQAYKLEGLFQGKIVEDGYPRIDKQMHTNRSALISTLQQRGLNLTADQRIVIYAPTWKGASVYAPANDISRLHSFVDRLSAGLPDDVTVLVKAHQLIYRQGVDDPDLRKILIPSDLDTNELLGITDLLITDYSSIFFDYLPLNRPIVFYVPDAEQYEQERGLYSPIDTLPGQIVKSTSESLLDTVLRGLSGQEPDEIKARRQEWRERWIPNRDTAATERIVEAVFFENPSPRSKVVDISSTDKTRILLHTGGLLNNGITRALQNLLDNIDYEKYDVSTVYTYANNADKLRNAELLNEKSRPLPRVGYTISTGAAKSAYKRFLETGQISTNEAPLVKDVFINEWRRMFGNAEFDVIIDFDGYSSFYSTLLGYGNGRRKVMWGHNDMLRDANREIDGTKRFGEKFNAIFKTYKLYDFQASVTEDLTKIHRRDLASYFPEDHFITVTNFLDAALIKNLAFGANAHASDPTPIQFDGTARDALEHVIARFGYQIASAELERLQLIHEVMIPEEEYINFVTAARLSTEKNQQLMIKAFAAVHQRHPYTRLVIIGDGPLMQELKQLARTLNVSDSVVFAGHQHNPFALVASADCFVFSSIYEGQGLALLEARVLNVPVVTTEYNVVHSVLGPGEGLITEPTIDGLAWGLEQFLEGKVPNPVFDVERYNQIARSQFDSLIQAALK